MSNIPLDHECFKYIFKLSPYGEFWCDIVDGKFGYWYHYFRENRDEWNTWDISLAYLEHEYPTWTKDRMRYDLMHYDFVGPMQPPPSPIIKKIREMEKRRQVAYA